MTASTKYTPLTGRLFSIRLSDGLVHAVRQEAYRDRSYEYVRWVTGCGVTLDRCPPHVTDTVSCLECLVEV